MRATHSWIYRARVGLRLDDASPALHCAPGIVVSAVFGLLFASPSVRDINILPRSKY